jgi:hypothetical protein
LPVDKVPTGSISIAAVGQVKTGSGRLPPDSWNFLKVLQPYDNQ